VEIPQFVFVTLAKKRIKKVANTLKTTVTTTHGHQKNIQEQIYIKCDVIQSCFTYNFYCFIIVTKDERAMVVKPTTNDRYIVYNTHTKSYESLISNQFNDFLTATANSMVLCYKTYDMAHKNPKLEPSTFDMNHSILCANLDSSILSEKFHKYMSKLRKPLRIGPYQLESAHNDKLIEPTYKLNDEQLNAHLHVTTTLSNGIILFDSIAFSNYHRRGFQNSKEYLNQKWFTQNIILVPIHHSQHWFLFVIDIAKKKIILFDSLPTSTTTHETYLNTITQLIRTQYFYTHKSTIDFTDWTIIKDFPDWRQDDDTSCGIRCGLFARSYISLTKYPPINSMNIKTFRTEFALHLLEYKQK
jgi:hypothetical protein